METIVSLYKPCKHHSFHMFTFSYDLHHCKTVVHIWTTGAMLIRANLIGTPYSVLYLALECNVKSREFSCLRIFASRVESFAKKTGKIAKQNLGRKTSVTYSSYGNKISRKGGEVGGPTFHLDMLPATVFSFCFCSCVSV